MGPESALVLRMGRFFAMRSFTRLLRSAGLVLLLTSHLPLHASDSYPIEVRDVAVGFPAGPFSRLVDETGRKVPLHKGGMWIPVRVELEIVQPVREGAIEIRAETPDADDVMTRSRAIIPAPEPSSVEGKSIVERTLYVKPGGLTSEVVVQAFSTATGKALSSPQRVRIMGMTPSRYLLLGIGGKGLNGLRIPKVEGTPNESIEPTTEPLRQGWVELSHIQNIHALPNQWYGYSSVDQVLLLTSQDDFNWELLRDDTGRKTALLEWVARGGRLIISAGANGKTLELPGFSLIGRMIPGTIGPAKDVRSLPMVLPGTPRITLAATSGTIPVATFQDEKEGRKKFPLIRLASDEAVDPLPLVVQTSYGLGRVTVVLFDLDSPAMASWKHREVFWDWLLNAAGPRLPTATERVVDAQMAVDEDRYLTHINQNLDYFESVPMISFGWVALLLLGYLILIGPLERYLLRRFFGRLEWTWLTFPVIIMAVCLLTYLAATSYKGREIRVNKIDLVDVDLTTSQVFGRTWFNVFSPKNDTFDVSLEPAYGPLWPTPRPQTILSWNGRVKGNRQTLFRRTYEYAAPEEVNGFAEGFARKLEKVPIPIWSTKSFQAEWFALMSPGDQLFKADLHIAEADPNQIVGSITAQLPVELITDAYLLYRERAMPLQPLLRGVPTYMATSAQASSATSWLQGASDLKDPASFKLGKSLKAEAEGSPVYRLWPVLFHEATLTQFARLQNASLRDLDQSWRLGEKNEYQAILVARLGTTMGPYETMRVDPAQPTRLSLQSRSGMSLSGGTLRQETYLRVFLPVQPARSSKLRKREP